MGWGPVPLPGEKAKEASALHDAAKFIDGLDAPCKISPPEKPAVKNFWRDSKGNPVRF